MTEESANQLSRIPVRIFPYGPPHTDRHFVTTKSGPNVFIENKAVQNRRKMKPNEVFIDENVKIDDLQFDLGDEWSSMMLNDFDTSVFGKENELGDDSQSFYQQTSCAQFL